MTRRRVCQWPDGGLLCLSSGRGVDGRWWCVCSNLRVLTWAEEVQGERRERRAGPRNRSCFRAPSFELSSHPWLPPFLQRLPEPTTRCPCANQKMEMLLLSSTTRLYSWSAFESGRVSIISIAAKQCTRRYGSPHALITRTRPAIFRPHDVVICISKHALRVISLLPISTSMARQNGDRQFLEKRLRRPCSPDLPCSYGMPLLGDSQVASLASYSAA